MQLVIVPENKGLIKKKEIRKIISLWKNNNLGIMSFCLCRIIRAKEVLTS